MLTSFTRVTRFAFQNFWRDIWLSTVTIVIFVLAISLVGILSAVKVVTDQAISVLRSKVDVTITFKAKTSESLVLELKSKLEQLPETSSVTYMSADDNLENFKKLHADDPTITEGTDVLQANPFGPSLKVQARSLEEYATISKLFNDSAYAPSIESGKSVESNRIAIEKLSNFTKSVNRFSVALTIIFSIIAILVVINTMRIAIYSHREEIGIMKLVGASNWFVRGPFLIESVLIGILAAILSSLLLIGGISLLSGWFNTLFQGYDVNMTAYFMQHFISIFWVPLVGAVILSMASAGIAVGRYLRV
ncbi:MAG: permease-like cell division protein FtsX [Candidatus Kerfeldbacteria bacterium]